MVDEHVEPFSKENRPPTYQNGVIVTPLPQDTGELPASIPAGYPSDINSKGPASDGKMAEGSAAPAPQLYYNQPGYQELPAGHPAPVAHGMTVGPMSMDAPLYCPPQQDGPTFLGATMGHEPIRIHCGACGFQGYSHVIQTRGCAHGMWSLMTLGLGLLCRVGMDTHHFCPQCRKHVADAKLM